VEGLPEWQPDRNHDLVRRECIRRFLLHVLPNRFQRIRYYGFLGNRYRQEKLAQCRRLLGMPLPGRPIVPAAKVPPSGPPCCAGHRFSAEFPGRSTCPAHSYSPSRTARDHSNPIPRLLLQRFSSIHSSSRYPLA
jgi:hypothetical protein